MEQTARLVAAYLGVSANVVTQDDKQIALKTTDGTTLQGLAAVCSQIVSTAGPQGAELAGTNSPELEAQIQEWITWCTTELQPLVDDKLLKVNDWLATRTYLVGSRLTLADLAVFGTVHPAVVAFPVAQVGHFCNLIRWCDFIQHIADKQKMFTPLTVKLPKFQPPAPPAPAPAKAAAAKADAKPEAEKAAAKEGAAKADAAKPAEKAAKGEQKAPAAAAAASATAAAAAPAAPAAPKEAKEAKQKGGKEKAAAAPAAKDDDDARIDMLDLRIGKIVKVQKHPNADALYLEEIDVGENKPRQVISGLVKFVPEDKMQDRMVVVVCNLKPAKMREVMSYGMVLCASNETHDAVDPVNPPAGAKVGDRVTVAGYESSPMEEINPKKKILERLFPDMKTDAAGNPVYKGVAFTTSAGPITSTIPNGWVK